jgi:hypothetical protein
MPFPFSYGRIELAMPETALEAKLKIKSTVILPDPPLRTVADQCRLRTFFHHSKRQTQIDAPFASSLRSLQVSVTIVAFNTGRIFAPNSFIVLTIKGVPSISGLAQRLLL